MGRGGGERGGGVAVLHGGGVGVCSVVSNRGLSGFFVWV